MDTISKAGVLTLSPFFVFFGKYAWKIGITKNIREMKEAVTILRQKSMEILKQRT